MPEPNLLPDLDDPAVYQETDPQGARRRIFDMAGQARAAWDLVMNWAPTPLPLPPRAVLIVGMGGSAIGGDLLRVWALPHATIPILVQRDYGLPAHVGPHTLILASSYSGNTEETLSAAEEAHRRDAPLVIVATGGELARRAGEWGSDILRFTYPAQPREALGYSLLLLLGALVRLDLLPDPTPEVQQTMDLLEGLQDEYAPSAALGQNPAKQLAAWLHGHLPLVIGAGLLAPVARRWKTQLNENSKTWACYDELPEMNHNLVAGTEHPRGLSDKVRAIFMTSALDHPRNRRRQEITQGLLQEAGVACRAVAARGRSPLAHTLSSVLLGDAASYYLAMLNRADPTPIPAIAALKEALAGPTT